MMEKYNSNTDVSLAKEPEVYYLIQNPLERIIGVFGGSTQVGQTINSDIDLISLTRRGLPKVVIFNVCDVLNISLERLSDLLHISARTLQRKSDADLLPVAVTQQLLDIAEVISEGIDVLGTLENFQNWIHSTPYILNGQKPLDFLDTRVGARYIRNILGRISYGIPS